MPDDSPRSPDPHAERHESVGRVAALARPPEGLIATDATRRLLWGVLTGGAAWLAVALAGGAFPALVGWATVACVALLELPGIAVAAVLAAISVGEPHAPAKALTIALIVGCVAVALGGPVVRIAQRCGGLPLDALLIVATVGALAVGPAGSLLAPVALAVVWALVRRTPT
jgi:hypothetical protein